MMWFDAKTNKLYTIGVIRSPDEAVQVVTISNSLHWIKAITGDELCLYPGVSGSDSLRFLCLSTRLCLIGWLIIWRFSRAL